MEEQQHVHEWKCTTEMNEGNFYTHCECACGATYNSVLTAQGEIEEDD